MNKYYAGIGARETPDEVCEIMKRLAKWLAEEGWVLRSGGAIGADSAFEAGCNLVYGKKEIFLPIPFYNQNKSTFTSPPEKAYALVDSVWTNYSKRSVRARASLARNCQQILGPDLDVPSDFVLCWTKDGTAIGGTGTAIRIATMNQIPVLNLFDVQADDMLNDKADFLKYLDINILGLI